jgi:hypothetical protein
MANKIKIKNSNVKGKIPTPADLDVAELAINLADKKVFTKEPGGTVVELANYADTQEVFDGTVTDKAIAPDTLAANSINQKKVAAPTGGVPGAVTIDLTITGQQMIFTVNNPNSLTELDADYEIKWAFKSASGTVLIPKGTKLKSATNSDTLAYQFETISTATNFAGQLNSNFPSKFLLMGGTSITGATLVPMGLTGLNATTFTFSFLLAKAAGAGGSDSADKWIKANSNGMLDNSLIPSLKNPTSTPTDDEDYLIRLDNTGHIHDGFLSELDAGNY